MLQKIPMSQKDLEKLAAEQRLYAILDVCGSPLLQAKISSLAPEVVACLYRAEPDDEIRKSAPYVARLDNSLLAWLAENVWTTPWGVLLTTTADLKSTRKHLRKFLVIKDHEGQVVYFRYYDPRVLPTFLGACTDAELQEFFGPFLAFGVAGPNFSGSFYVAQV